MKEKEEKKTHSRKRHSPKDKATGKKCRKTAAKSKKANKEHKTFVAAIQHLQTAVDVIGTTLDSDKSNGKFDFVL